MNLESYLQPRLQVLCPDELKVPQERLDGVTCDHGRHFSKFESHGWASCNEMHKCFEDTVASQKSSNVHSCTCRCTLSFYRLRWLYDNETLEPACTQKVVIAKQYLPPYLHVLTADIISLPLFLAISNQSSMLVLGPLCKQHWGGARLFGGPLTKDGWSLKPSCTIKNKALLLNFYCHWKK